MGSLMPFGAPVCAFLCLSFPALVVESTVQMAIISKQTDHRQGCDGALHGHVTMWLTGRRVLI